MKIVSTSEEKKEHSPNKAEDFLGVLEKKVEELKTAARTPEISSAGISFEVYQRFRNIMAECLSFMIIIEQHLDRLEGLRAEELRHQFDLLTVAVWSTLLDGSLRLLRLISEKEFLPIGTRHIFIHELKTLYDAKNTLARKGYESMVNQQVSHQRDTAEKILTEIIERAPRLLNLEEE